MKRRELLKYMGVAALMPFVTGLPVAATPESKPRESVILGNVSVKLPNGYCFLDIAGQTVFPRYGASGGLTCQAIVYLFRSRDDMLRFKGEGIDIPYDKEVAVYTQTDGVTFATIQLSKLAELRRAGIDLLGRTNASIYSNYMQQLVNEAVRHLD